ncbi:MAG TPA: hypothetical protein VF545_11460 [Thermoleophilaceae bacterium]|jgi:hypothetical protein
MDSEGPDTLTGREAGAQSIEDSVASGTSARVGAILSRAEARGRAIRDESERQAQAVEDAARAEARRIHDDARRAAQAAARERVRDISALRASIAARAGSLVDGLEGAELTRVRLEELVAVLGDAADALLADAGGEAVAAPLPAARGEAGDEGDADGARADARSGAEAASPARDGSSTGDGAPAVPGARPPAGAVPYEGQLPDGAPMARRPTRAREARFTAVLMAIQGIDRAGVEDHLQREFGDADCDQLLDDVFGRADAPA